MSVLFEMYKQLGMCVSFQDETYDLHYVKENGCSKKSGYPKYHDLSTTAHSTKRTISFTTKVESTGVTRISSIETNKLFTANEAEMLRQKGHLVVSKKFVQH